MDRPASYVPPAQQQGPASAPVSSIQSILAFSRPSPPRLPDLLQTPGLIVDPSVSQGTSVDGRQQANTSEPDFANDDGMQPSADGGSRRRSINSSKRAAQNRAAQRAFRLRRERYVAGLEEKARNFDRLEAAYLEIQRENYQLRSSVHKLNTENTALRSHMATSAPVSPAPSSMVSTSFSPTSAGHSIAHPLSQHPGIRPVALAEPEKYYQYGHIGYHHQQHQHQAQPQSLQQQQHLHQLQQPQRQKWQQPSQHQHQHPIQPEYPPFAQMYTNPAPTTTPTHPISPMPSTGPAHAHTAHHAALALNSPGPAAAGTHYHTHSPGGPNHPGPLQKHFYRDRSLPNTNTLDPLSPLPNAAPAALQHAAVLAASVHSTEKVPWDRAPGIDSSSPATEPLPHKPSANPDPAISGSSATAAPTLPSVREITMSIGAMLPSGPHIDRGQSAQIHATKPCSSSDSSNSQMEECVDFKRRPW